MVILTSDPSMLWATAALCVPSPGSCTRTARGASSRSRCSNERRASSEPELWSASKQRAWQALSRCCVAAVAASDRRVNSQVHRVRVPQGSGGAAAAGSAATQRSQEGAVCESNTVDAGCMKITVSSFNMYNC